MHVAIKSLSDKIVKRWRDAAWTVKQAQEKFIAAYVATLVEVGGNNWAATWRAWDNFDDVVGYLEKQVQEVCLSEAMALTTFNKYRRMARMHAFHGVPAKFGANFTIGEIKEAQSLAESYAEGTAEARMNRAYQEIRARKNTKGAQSHLAKKGATVLLPPKEGQSREQYRMDLLRQINRYFDNAQVDQVLQERDLSAQALRLVRTTVRDCLASCERKNRLSERTRRVPETPRVVPKTGRPRFVPDRNRVLPETETTRAHPEEIIYNPGDMNHPTRQASQTNRKKRRRRRRRRKLTRQE